MDRSRLYALRYLSPTTLTFRRTRRFSLGLRAVPSGWCEPVLTTAFERRWRKKYAGFLCRFGETVLFRTPHPQKGWAAFVRAIWLGKDTESDQHFVADGSGVCKTRSVMLAASGLGTSAVDLRRDTLGLHRFQG